MTTVAYALPPRPSYLRVLWGVAVGAFVAGLGLGLLSAIVSGLGFADSDQLVAPSRLGVFPADSPWAIAANLVCLAFAVSICGWWVHYRVMAEAHRPVSLPVVLAIVALAALFLLIRPDGWMLLIVFLLAGWAIRAFAIDSGVTIHVSGRMWLAAAVAGLLVVGSYVVFHPLVGRSSCSGGDARTTFFCLDLTNGGFSDVRILSVSGAAPAPRWSDRRPLQAPATLGARGESLLYVPQTGCTDPTVRVTYRTLGLTHTKRFRLNHLGYC